MEFKPLALLLPKRELLLTSCQSRFIPCPFVLLELNIEGDVKVVRNGFLVEELRLVYTECKFNVERVNEVQQERNGTN